MANSTPGESRPPDNGAIGPTNATDWVESVVGENVTTVIIDEPGDTTHRPLPEAMLRQLRNPPRPRLPPTD